MKYLILKSISILIISFSIINPLGAAIVTRHEAVNVAVNWIEFCAQNLVDHWNGSDLPAIESENYLLYNSDTLAYVFQIEPSGNVVISKYQEMTPVISYSTSDRMNMEEIEGIANILRIDLSRRNLLLEDYLSGKSDLPESPDGLPAVEINKNKWRVWSLEAKSFKRQLGGAIQNTILDVGPLLDCAWRQVEPYYNFCPLGDGGGTCVVGCVATATAQLMYYWNWPPEGIGDHEYWWNGDGSAPGKYLRAEFGDPYSWDKMLPNYTDGYNQEQADAAAELSYEVGIAFNMDYHVAGSGANTADCMSVLPGYFKYKDTIVRSYRPDFTAEEWFLFIKRDLDLGRPLLYRKYQTGHGGHAMVCDGWRIAGNYNQIHINYGWGDSHNTWYTIDNLYSDPEPENNQIYSGIEPDYPLDIPTLSQWGMIIMGLLFLALASIALLRSSEKQELFKGRSLQN